MISNERRRGAQIKWEGDDKIVDDQADNSRRLMTVQLHGRTGNMMFAYASMLGLAKQVARTAVFPSDHYFRMLFKLSVEPKPRKGIKSWVRFVEKHACVYDRRLTEGGGDSSADVVELLGYFQSWRYFDDIKDVIRKEFTFRNDIAERSSDWIELAVKRSFGTKVRRGDVTLVGLHVRRGDMALYSSFLLGYSTASSEYLDNAMAYFTERYNNSRLLFILCSDDFEWCEDNVKERGTPIFRMERASDAVHLAVLASCNHTIMTVGSFGWWGAWLAGGTTIYYKNFPRPASPLATDFLAQDYFYPNWIGM